MSVSPKNTKPPSATLAAVEQIRKLIFSGELTADSNHLESELATRLGMSRTPVREATLVLAEQGLLEVRPRKGIRINAVSVHDMAEIYEVLTELEGLAAKRAAQAGHDKSALVLLAQCIERMDSALAKENRETWALADEDFHTELVRLAGNKRIEDICSNFNDQVRRARSVTLHIRPLPVKSNEDHRALYEAILNGDARRAQTIHRKHRHEASLLQIRLLTQSGLVRV